jgi:hypothetical protein
MRKYELTHLGCATKGERPVFDDFREPEIRYSQVTISIQQQIFRFQVPIDDILLMQIVDSEDDAGQVKSSDVCCESSRSTQVREQLSAGNVR